MIDWQSQEEVRTLLPKDIESKVIEALPKMPGHIWIATSGSVHGRRMVALSKEAFLISAKAVNEFLQLQSIDKYLNPLSKMHVGGLSVDARKHLAGFESIDFEKAWDASQFYEALIATNATITSLVPTQVYDLIQLGSKCPDHLRVVIVGGGHLTPQLYNKALDLGYPVLPSYGMTECASQIATAHLDTVNQSSYPAYQVLPHVEVKVDINGILMVKSESLLTGYVEVPENFSGELELVDPKRKGWFRTEDHISLKDGAIDKIMGRVSDVVKVSGDLVHLGFLQQMWDSNDSNVKGVVLAVPDERRENNIVLVVESKKPDDVQADVKKFEMAMSVVANLSGIYYVDEIPCSEIGKVQKQKLTKTLGF